LHIHAYPEAELVVEPEEEDEDAEAADVQDTLQRYNARVDEEGELDEEELPPEVVDSVEEQHTAENKQFAMFQVRIAGAPDQCLRYCFQDSAEALWPIPRNIPSPADIPPCPCCGASRKFEFQVLPQMLNHLDLDDTDPKCIDWATLAVYTCSKSCEPQSREETSYLEEFVWVQGMQ
jgi:pre-rRNA-processing protein TSR4